MNKYLVTWEIEIDADTELEAAREALKIQRDTQSTATVFDIKKFDCDEDAIRIDLCEWGTK